MHPSGASGTGFEAVPEPAQFKLRTPESEFACSAWRIANLGGWQHGRAVSRLRIARWAPCNIQIAE
eukprot:2799271-Alexandrium_andersonii.AAC.1